MKKTINKFFILLIIILVSIFTGYENPNLVEVPKKYINHTLKKIGLKDSFVNKKVDNDKLNKLENEKKDFKELSANSFSLIFSKVKSYSGKTASLIINNNNNKTDYEIFTRNGLLIKNENTSEINLPLLFYNERDGGVKSVFTINDEYFALISLKKFSCLYAALIHLKSGKKIIESKCLPDKKKVDFGGLGGAYVKNNNNILLTIGTPTHQSEEISALAQSKNSIFGKVLLIKNETLLSPGDSDQNYEIFSLGHRNPQGLVLYKKNIFSLEHGPQGGDELNEIIKGKNYGWPIVSLGTKYNNGKSFSRSHSKYNFKEPIYAFLPAVAPSSLNVCPENLSTYYQNNICLMGLSLRGGSIIIFIINKNNILNIEKISFKKRLRHFGLDKSGKLFFDKESYFYITADNDGLYKVKFSKFR